MAGELKQGKPLVEFRPLTSAVLPDVFAGHDEITAITVGASIAGVGTRLGNVCVWEHGVTNVRKIPMGNACIHALATDSDGFFVAAATGDGRIVVWPLGNGGEPWVAEHSRLPVLGLALAPNFGAQKDTFALCAGGDDGRLILHRRTFLGGQTLLHSGEGQINQVRWRASLIAWGNEKGVKVYNTATSQKVTYVPRPQGGGRVTGLLWISDDQLAMSWSSAVKLAVILPAEGANLYAQVRHDLPCPDVIHGLGLAGPGALSTLEVTGRSAFLKLQGPSGGLFHAVEVPFSRGAFHSHLFLQTGAPHLPMLAAGPRDLLMFQIRDLLEYAVQLLEEGNFDEAIRLANGGGEGIQGLRHIVCLKCLTPDVKDGNFVRACQTLQRFRHLEAPTWQESLVLFDRAGALPHLALQLPVPPKEQLPNEVYDDALRRLVHYPSALVAVLAYWPNDIFSTSELQAILHKDAPSFTSSTELSQEDRCRAEALARLSENTDPDLAVELLLKLSSSEVFKMVRRLISAGHDPAKWLLPKLQQFFEVDDKQACELAVACRASLPVDHVMSTLEECESRWKHEYLKQLFAQDEIAGQGYHLQMVELFAEYDPSGLQPFLRASERYPLDQALEVCQRKGLRQEVAYLLGRAGRVADALRILLEEVGDVRQAVEFAAETQDPELWEMLVSFVLQPQHSHLLVPLLDQLDALDSRHLAALGTESQKPRPPPMATPSHVLRLLPGETPLARIASSVQRVLDSLRLSSELHATCFQLSSEEMVSVKKHCMTAYRRGRGFSVSASGQPGGYGSLKGIRIAQDAGTVT